MKVRCKCHRIPIRRLIRHSRCAILVEEGHRSMRVVHVAFQHGAEVVDDAGGVAGGVGEVEDLRGLARGTRGRTAGGRVDLAAERAAAG
jgi:hypothetical protein